MFVTCSYPDDGFAGNTNRFAADPRAFIVHYRSMVLTIFLVDPRADNYEIARQLQIPTEAVSLIIAEYLRAKR